MDSDMVETVTEWDSEPFTGGYDGLRDLAGREFSGAVTEGVAWLFMLNGRVVGVFDGTIEDFEAADGTAYAAPHPSLPLLFAMQETGGETRAKYYTEDTPLSEADRTLKSGNFTGYVELSENVLSGDYYVVYQGGKSMSVAFVGNNRKLLTGEEAFERADDEVGIYEVKTVDLDVVEIPGEETASGGASGAAAAGEPTEREPAPDTAAESGGETEEDATAADQSGVTFGDESRAEETSSATAAEPETEPQSATGSATGTAEPETSEAPTGTTEATVETTDADGEASIEPRTETSSEAAGGAVVAEPESEPETAAAAGESPEPAAESTEAETETEAAAEAEAETGGDVFAEEEQWRETKTIPALDPSNSVEIETKQGSVAGRAARSGTAQSGAANGGTSRDTAESTTGGRAAAGRGQSDRLAEVQSELADLRDQRDRLAEEYGRLRDEREELVAERDRLEQERAEAERRADSLASRVEELEGKIDRLESELETARQDAQQARQSQQAEEPSAAGGQQLSAEQALTGTNLFVRYRSKSGGTLGDAHDSSLDRDEVNENLRLEHHTTFDDEDVVVDGEPFESFLTDTIEYGFGRWVVEDLLYEIRETGNRAGLGDLYDAIPNVDRIEFRGEVELEDEAGETRTERFDVVCRDRMGNPLLVANLNDSREAATESMLGSLIESATPVAEVEETLSAAFFVTTSFFDPGALETAADATGGGLLRREKRKSFVKLSRKQGYHLCLVETRNGEFHVNVPEL